MKKEIYLAGGCFWGMQAYFEQIKGVQDTSVGYANGTFANPSYEQVCRGDSGFAETLKIGYEDTTITLTFLLDLYFDVIDPTILNRQGNDRGTQYRTGIYYVDHDDKQCIEAALHELSNKYDNPIVVESLPLQNFYPAEAYHQEYLRKNPGGYCHISKSKIAEAKTITPPPIFKKPSDEVLKQTLSDLSYKVTQKSATEAPFQNAYWQTGAEGIYVDITTQEPLFYSFDKFDSGCGWPSFTKPMDSSLVDELSDTTHGMTRVEVRSKLGDAHLGHVFDDGPSALGGLRYCINSASLRFIAKQDMEKEGYGAWLSAFDNR